MNNKILNSILITTLLVLSVYFVSSISEGTFGNDGIAYNTTQTAYPSVNFDTNYTQGGAGIILNISINNTDGINGEITNITFAFSKGIGDGLFNVTDWATNISGIMNTTYKRELYNFSINFTNDYSWRLDNASGNGILNNSVMFTWINITANATAETTGTLTIITYNGSGYNAGSATFTMGVDGLGPRISSIQATTSETSIDMSWGGNTNNTEPTLDGTNNNISISAIITDANLNASNRLYNVSLWWNETNNTGGPASIGSDHQINMTTSCTTPSSGCLFSATLPKFSDGTKVSFIIVATDDFQQTTNVTNVLRAFNLTIDSTDPGVPVITTPDEKLLEHRTYSISCSGDNRTILEDVDTGTTICDSQSPGTCTGDWNSGNQGTKEFRCTNYDAAGNTKQTTTEVIVYSTSTTSGGGGTTSGTTEPSETVDISSTPQNVETSTGDTSIFTYGTKEHTLTIDSLTSDSVTVTIDNKITETIGKKQSKEVDIDGDGNNDIKLTLNAVRLNKADITIEKLAGATPEPQEQTEVTGKSLAWLWWLLGIVVIGVVIYLVVMQQKKKK